MNNNSKIKPLKQTQTEINYDSCKQNENNLCSYANYYIASTIANSISDKTMITIRKINELKT